MVAPSGHCGGVIRKSGLGVVLSVQHQAPKDFLCALLGRIRRIMEIALLASTSNDTRGKHRSRTLHSPVPLVRQAVPRCRLYVRLLEIYLDGHGKRWTQILVAFIVPAWALVRLELTGMQRQTGAEEFF